MSISTTDYIKRYVGNGSLAAYSFPYYASASSDIKVELDDIAQSSGFSVSGSGSSWTVTFTTAPAVNVKITIYRSTTNTQASDYITNDAIDDNVIEGDFDKRTAVSQEIKGEFNRSIKLPRSDTPDSANSILGAVATRKSKALGFDASGDLDYITINNVAASNAAGITYTPAGASADDTTVQAKLREFVSVKDFSATGDGATDDRSFIQDALDSLTSGGTLYFPAGTYLIGRQTGTEQTGTASAADNVTERWGVKITNSNVKILCDKGVTFKRHITPSGTWDGPNAAADATEPSYAIWHIGETESNDSGDQVTDIEFVGGHIEGNDIRHTASTSAICDHNTGIFIRNADRVRIDGVKFTKVDSSAIFTWLPGSLVNTTQVTNLDILNCTAIGESHTTSERALMHCFWITADYWSVVNCKFEWVDNGVGVNGTYFNFSDSGNWTETTNSLGSVPRSGRGGQIIGCHFENCSEHGIYAETVDLVIANNTFVGLSTYVANDAKLRVRGATCVGNNFFNRKRAWAITEASSDISISGGKVTLSQLDSIGISFDNQDVQTWITNRSEWAPNAVTITATTISATASGNTIDDSGSGFGSFAVDDIVNVAGFTGTAANNDIYRVTAASAASLTLEGNTLVDDAAGESVTVTADALPVMRNLHVDGVVFTREGTLASSVQDYGVNINSDTSAPSNYFQGWTVQGVSITNCQFFGFREGVHINGDHVKDLKIEGNVFHGKKFLENNFTLDTTLDSECVIGIHANASDMMKWISFKDNKVRGFQTYIKQTEGTQVTSRTYSIPKTSGNEFEYLHTLWGLSTSTSGNHGTDGNTVTLDNTSNIVQWTAHTLAQGERVRFTSGTLPSELDNAHWYFVAEPNANDFRLSYLENDLDSGTPASSRGVSFSSDGSGTIQVSTRYCSSFVRPSTNDTTGFFTNNTGSNVFDWDRERAFGNVITSNSASTGTNSSTGNDAKMANFEMIDESTCRVRSDNQGTTLTL